MSAIYDAKVSNIKVTQVSTPEEDRKNGGCPRWRVSATVEFEHWGMTASEVLEDAKHKFQHALS
jgi:hypothetical protein